MFDLRERRDPHSLSFFLNQFKKINTRWQQNTINKGLYFGRKHKISGHLSTKFLFPQKSGISIQILIHTICLTG